MTPRIGYLIDENRGWEEEPDWKFYTERDVPRYKIDHARKDSVKRIVYFEVPEED